MAIKIKKKSDKKTEEEALLEEDDQILEASQDTFDWLSANRNLVIGGLVVLVVGIIAATWYMDHRKGRIAEASGAAYEALAETFRPVRESPQLAEGEAPVPEAEIFANRAEQLAAVRSKASDVVADYENRRAGNEARLLVASAALELGDASEALDGYQQFRESSDTRLGELVATIGQATAQAAAGNLEQGLSTIDGIMGRYDNLRANLAIHKARLIDTYGEPADALTAYREIIGSDATLENVDVDSLESRIALLEIELGETGEAANAEGQDAE